MKIHIPYSKKLRGPQIFCDRLYTAMQENPEVELTTPECCSVQLHPITFCDIQKDVKNVLRLDGVYIHSGSDHNWKESNKPLRKSFNLADGIVYQSYFSKVLCEKYLGETRVPYAIIHNGADPRKYRAIEPRVPPFFLTVANWRSFKRLRDTIESFLLADFKNINLVVVGDISKAGIEDRLQDYKKDSRIQFLGNLNQRQLVPYYNTCIALIHISWIDNCPNTAVEAICAGKPVVCGNLGGTKEIVSESGGIVLDIEQEYNLEPVNLNSLPPISWSTVAEALHRCVNERFTITNSHVDIRNTADKYLAFFRKIS